MARRYSWFQIILVTSILMFMIGSLCAADVLSDVDRGAAELLKSRDYQGAAAIYQELIKHNPTAPQVADWYYEMSRCYWITVHYPECFTSQEKALELVREPIKKKNWQHESAMRYYLAGKYDKALPVLEKLITENPKDSNCADWYVRMSLCHRLSGNGEKSIEALGKAIELAVTPQLKQKLRVDRAIEYSLIGNYDNAKTEYERLVEDYPDASSLPYWNREISLCHWRQKKYPDCFPGLIKAIAGVKDLDTKRVWTIGCGVRAYQVREYKVVASVLAEPVKKSPNVHLSRLVARSHVHLHDWKNALDAYQMLKKTFPQYSSEWQLWTGYCYEQQGKYKGSEAIYRELIKKYPKDDLVSCAYFRLARCLVKEAKAKQALTLLDTYYRDGNHKPEAMFWKAEILVEMQKHKEALPVLKKYLSYYSKHNLVEEAKWLMVSSLIHTNQWSQAKSITESLLQQEIIGNGNTGNAQGEEDLDMFPETNDNKWIKLASSNELAHAPRESLARTRYAMGHYYWKGGSRKLAECIMHNIIEQYSDCNTAKEANSTLDLWKNGESERL